MHASLPAPARPARAQGSVTTSSLSVRTRACGAAAATFGVDTWARVTGAAGAAGAGRTLVGALCAPATVCTTTGGRELPPQWAVPRAPPISPRLTTPRAVGAT